MFVPLVAPDRIIYKMTIIWRNINAFLKWVIINHGIHFPLCTIPDSICPESLWSTSHRKPVIYCYLYEESFQMHVLYTFNIVKGKIDGSI